jgi:mannosyltransferase
MALALAVGGFLRFHNLDAQEMSADEGFSWQAAAAPTLHELVQTQLELNSGKGPLHDLALHYWMGRFGDSVAAMRSLSALVGTLAILLAFLAARELLRIDWGPALSDDDRNFAAACATLMLALDPMAVQYSREARMYPMLLAAVLAQVACFARAARSGGWGAWAGVVLFTPVAIAAHFMAGLVFAVEALWLGMVAVRNRWDFSAPQARRVLSLAGALALGAAALLPFAHTLIHATVFDAHHGGFEWIAPPKASAPFYFFITGVGFRAILPMALLAVWGAVWGWPHAKGAVVFMILWMWVPALMLMVLSYVFMPAFVNRYLISSLVPLFTLAAMGIIGISFAPIRVAMLAVIVALSLWDVEAALHRVTDAQWREAARVAAIHVADGGSIDVVPDWTMYVVRYYLRGSPAETAVERPGVPKSTVILFLRRVSRTTEESYKREYPVVLASLRRIVVLSSGRPADPATFHRTALFTAAQPKRLPAADERHLGRHHRHEQHVGVEWQARHVDHRARDLLGIEGRLDL